jgi:phospholipase C
MARARKLKCRSLLLVGTAVFAAALTMPGVALAASGPNTRTAIKHVVVIVQENHTFDNYFANYCQSRIEAKQRPQCDGGPTTYPGTTTAPVVLDDVTMGAHDPNHTQSCETAEINGGKMDGYLRAPPEGVCGAPDNFSYAGAGASSPVAYYQQLATKGALADHYFQPVTGESSSNDMYLWTTRFVFPDNQVEPNAIGQQCSTNSNVRQYDDSAGANKNIGKTLSDAGVSWAWYAEGYSAMQGAGSSCPPVPAGCGITLQSYPCVYDPSDIPAEYYASSADKAANMRDYSQLATDIASGGLPSVVFVKALGFNSEHPGSGTKLSSGVAFVQQTVDAIQRSKLAKDTLVLVTWDESGGYYDHVAPPAASTVDQQPYGPRVPLLAVGRFARRGAVSHQTLEHSSITKFVEWNWLKGKTGQLGGRDQVVHNLGSVLAASLKVPSR